MKANLNNTYQKCKSTPVVPKFKDHRVLGHRVADFAWEFIFLTRPRWCYLLFHTLRTKLWGLEFATLKILLELRESCSLPVGHRTSLESPKFKRNGKEIQGASMVEIIMAPKDVYILISGTYTHTILRRKRVSADVIKDLKWRYYHRLFG